MFELTINGRVYQFKFGMGFMREINKTLTKDVDGAKGAKQNVGLRYAVANIIDGDVEALIEVLEIANKGFDPRITRNELDAYIDNENTDIDELFKKVLDFFKKANATRKTTMSILEAIEAEKAKQN